MSGVSSRVRTTSTTSTTRTGPTRSPSSGPASTPVTASLEALVAEGWVVLHDERRRRRSATPGLVVVGVGGVAVVDLDERPWRLSVDAPVLRLGRRSGARACVATAARAAGVLSLLGAVHRADVQPVLCVVDSALPPVEVEAGVLAVGGLALADALRSLPARLDAAQVQRVAAHLEREVHGAGAPGSGGSGVWGAPEAHDVPAIPAPRAPLATSVAAPSPLAVFGARRPADRTTARR